MKMVATAAGHDIDCAGRSYVGADIQRGLLNAEFRDGFVGNIGHRRADGFVGDVHAIHLNAGHAAAAATDGNARKLVLGGIEGAAVHDLHARFLLRQVKEVAAIERKRLDAGGIHRALHGSLGRVHRHRRAFHGHDRGGGAQFQLRLQVRHHAHTDRYDGLKGLKAFFDYRHLVAGRWKVRHHEVSRGIGFQLVFCPSRLIGHNDPGPGNSRALWIDHCARDRAGYTLRPRPAHHTGEYESHNSNALKHCVFLL